MPRVKIGPAQPDRKTIDIEIARLRDLDLGDLQARWHTVLGRRPSSHLPRHILFRVLAYRLQADHFGDLDTESRRLLDGAGSPEDAGKRAVDPGRLTADVKPGTVLAREWNGRMQRVAVMADGFAWNGKIYPSLSKTAFAITGTRWNGPKFFGMRETPSKEARS
jgi:Protein of unknown function (DUF2924)